METRRIAKRRASSPANGTDDDKKESNNPRGIKKIRYPSGQSNKYIKALTLLCSNWEENNMQQVIITPAQNALSRLYCRVAPHLILLKSLENERSLNISVPIHILLMQGYILSLSCGQVFFSTPISLLFLRHQRMP